MARRDLGRANLKQLAESKKQKTKKEQTNMIKRDKLGRFMSTKRVMKNNKACAVKAAKATKKTTTKKAAKKTAKKTKKA